MDFNFLFYDGFETLDIFGFANNLFGDEMINKVSEEIEYVWNPNKDCDVF